MLRSTRNHARFRPTGAPGSSPARRAFLTLERLSVQLGARRRLIQLGHPAQHEARVLQMWEAFLIQMDDFDRLLEFQLRRKLDPVVAAPVPVRGGRTSRHEKDRRVAPVAKAFGAIPLELRPDALVFVEHS
jgi:hypothetical protein